MGHAVAAQTSSRKHSFHCQTLTLPSEVPALQRGLVDTAYLERPWPWGRWSSVRKKQTRFIHSMATGTAHGPSN